MNRVYYTFAKLALLPAIMVGMMACVADVYDEKSMLDQPTAPVGMMTVYATAGTAGSRLAFEETDDNLSIMWSEKDAFSVFGDNLISHTFYLDSLSADNHHRASFVGVIPDSTRTGTTFYAVYPGLNDTVSLSASGIDLSEQSGRPDSTLVVYMWAKAIYEEGRELQFDFSNLTAVLKMTLAFPEYVTEVKDIRLTGLRSGGTVDISQGKISSLSDNDSIWVSRNTVFPTTTTTTNKTLTLFVSLLPQVRPQAIGIIAKSTDGNDTYAGTLTTVNTEELQSGCMYSAKEVEMVKKEP